MSSPTPSHRTFTFGNVIIDSNFDSGNCSNAQRVSHTNYNLWIGTDHPKNNYRTWFYFSVEGFPKGATVSFKIKNMQNQSRLLNEGLVPVYREASYDHWKRIKQRINTSNIEYYDGWIQWSFKHTWTSNDKVYLAFFYPWSNQDNSKFLDSISDKIIHYPDTYVHRATIIHSLEGRPIEMITISSKKGQTNKEEPIKDENLFQHSKRPLNYNRQKKCVVITARVHPGQVPGSHVMTGIIEELTEINQKAQALRDNFVFYLFPILNPDGVARGHYRVDTNGINLNRCYLIPTAQKHPSIYAVRKIIMHLHQHNKFFGFLDLHAHATRKGTFIYGNYTNQLIKQLGVCLFPKIISMNSMDFEYEASNFTEHNMYCKDKADHISKQGSGRVAIFKATKNPNCWTLQCNYNMSRVNNILERPKQQIDEGVMSSQNDLNPKIIVDYRCGEQKQATNFFTIETYRKLGEQICQSFLDLIQKNPYSRIQNHQGHFKSIQNLKMNLAVSLLRMQPSRFQTQFKKIYHAINSQDQAISSRALKALYYILIQNAKIENINSYIKDNDTSSIIYHSPIKPKSFSSKMVTRKPSNRRILQRTRSIKLHHKETSPISPSKNEKNNKETLQSNTVINFNSAIRVEEIRKMKSQSLKPETFETVLLSKLKIYERQMIRRRNMDKSEELKILDLMALPKEQIRNRSPKKLVRMQELPKLNKKKPSNFENVEAEPQLIRKGFELAFKLQNRGCDHL